jgi:GcrA cell cycle regulator
MSFWTPERVEELKRLHADGNSAAESAAELGGVTRNAVIGKLSRLGLTDADRAKKPKGARLAPRVQRTRVARRNDYLARERIRGRLRRAERQTEPEPAPDVTDIVRVKLVDLENTHCRFPVGHPSHDSFGFCGLPEANLIDGRPYCAGHAARTRQPRKPKPDKPTALYRPRPNIDLPFLPPLQAEGA